MAHAILYFLMKLQRFEPPQARQSLDLIMLCAKQNWRLSPAGAQSRVPISFATAKIKWRLCRFLCEIHSSRNCRGRISYPILRCFSGDHSVLHMIPNVCFCRDILRMSYNYNAFVSFMGKRFKKTYYVFAVLIVKVSGRFICKNYL